MDQILQGFGWYFYLNKNLLEDFKQEKGIIYILKLLVWLLREDYLQVVRVEGQRLIKGIL